MVANPINLMKSAFFLPAPTTEDIEKGQVETDPSKTLRGRFCVSWKVISASLPVVALALAIIFCIAWNKNIYTIPFAIGAFASLPSIYFAYHYEFLQSFATSASKFKQENEKLSTERKAYAEENQKLHEERTAYAEENEKLCIERKAFVQQNQKLREEREKYANLNETHQKIIEDDRAALEELRKALGGDVKEIADHLEKYLEKVKIIDEVSNETCESIKKEAGGATVILKDVVTQLKDLVTNEKLTQVMNATAVCQENLKKTQENLKTAMEMNLDQQKVLVKTTEEHQTKLSELQKLNDQLTNTKNEIAKTNESLKEMGNCLSHTGKNLDGHVTKLGGMINYIDIKNKLLENVKFIVGKLGEAKELHSDQKIICQDLKKKFQRVSNTKEIQDIFSHIEKTSDFEENTFQLIQTQLTDIIKQLNGIEQLNFVPKVTV